VVAPRTTVLRPFSEAFCPKIAMGKGYLVIVAVARTHRDARIVVHGPLGTARRA
jgi:hypothetical protein